MSREAPPGWTIADRALLETLVLEAPVAFAFYDPDLRYRRINRLLAEINGLPIEAHLGRRPTEVLDRELGEAVEAMLGRVLAADEVFSDENFRTTDPISREVRHWQSQWFPAHGPDGAIAGVAVLILDVTERRRTEQALRRSQQRSERLQQATAELAAALTVESVGAVIGRVGRAAVGARWSGLALHDPDSGTFRLHGAFPAGLPGTTDLPPLPADLPTITSEAVRSGEPIYVASRADLLAWLPHDHVATWLRVTDEQAWAVLPLRVGGQVIGALRFSFAEPRTLDYEERLLLEGLAAQCSLALERARLYERERTIARTLQRSLLPDRLPTVPGLELAARFLPGGDHAQVGGDWYDAFPLPSGRVGLVVGDVMGKGLGAATVMGRMRTALRALALTEESPAAVLTGLDRLVDLTEDLEQIVTLSYAVIDPAAGVAVGADAGHPPIVHQPPDGPPVLLDFNLATTPLGVPEERHEVQIRLRPGDTFLGYSDGLVETRDRGLSRGLDQLLREVERHGRGPLERMLDAVLAGMLTGQSRHDDVTLLAVRWTG